MGGGCFLKYPVGSLNLAQTFLHTRAGFFSVWGFAQMQAPYERDGY